MELYPLKFKPIFKEAVWGGNKLSTLLHKNVAADKKVGESWELSGVRNNLSVVSNGYLKGNTIDDLIEIYMGELVGDKVYEQFGLEFPLLIKFLDTTETLSVQVHPDDDTAAQRHHAFGKTEMWYIVNADANAKIALGFNKNSNLSELINHIEKNTIQEILNLESAKPGDAFYVPAGSIHAIGRGILLAEIQQTSDITYRVYDWGRNDKNRPLHMDLAMDVINYKQSKDCKIATNNSSEAELVSNSYFTTNLLNVTQATIRDNSELDSFVIYMCTEGSAQLTCKGHKEQITMGETVLVPASLSSVQITPQGKATLLEVYIK